MNSVTSEEEGNKTVIENIHVEYKQRLEEKTENLHVEPTKVDRDLKDLKEMEEENGKLRESYRALERRKEVEGEILAEKEREIKDLKCQLEGKMDMSQLFFNRNMEELFKMKPRKRTGSMTTVHINKCDNENCGTEDAGLVKCGICSKFVCEKCSEVPVGKLKPMVKACNRIYFICKLCHTKYDDEDVESCMAKLKIDDEIEIEIVDKKDRNEIFESERNDLQKVIKTMEQTQQSLNEMIADKEELTNVYTKLSRSDGCKQTH